MAQESVRIWNEFCSTPIGLTLIEKLRQEDPNGPRILLSIFESCSGPLESAKARTMVDFFIAAYALGMNDMEYVCKKRAEK